MCGKTVRLNVFWTGFSTTYIHTKLSLSAIVWKQRSFIKDLSFNRTMEVSDYVGILAL